MHATRDPKAMAKTLRQALAGRQTEISHSESLELVARQLGWRDWNTLAAQMDRPPLRLPEGWFPSGSMRDDYDMGLDEAEGCALIRYRHVSPIPISGQGSGFGTLMQGVQAEAYRGARIQLKAQIKAQDVTGAGTLWMRVDDARGRTIAFDNMETRRTDGPLLGNSGWQDRSIVLDVPDDAAAVSFGFYLRGSGSLWARRFRFGVVDASVPLTDSYGGRHRPEPVNLDFAAVA